MGGSARRAANATLATLIAESGLSHARLASAVTRVAAESGVSCSVGRSHVSHWVAGSRPSGAAPYYLCEALARRLGRPVTLADVGLCAAEELFTAPAPDWRTDGVESLSELGRADVDPNRRRLLAGAVYSVSALAVPDKPWWDARTRPSDEARVGATGHRVGRADVDAARDTTELFSRLDQRRGGGHARTAVAHYLVDEVVPSLRGSFRSDATRREMLSVAGELAYLCGWMAFDDAHHAVAQHYFVNAVKLAAEARDAPLAGHVLRAMAHQAVDLHHPARAADLASASVEGERYTTATRRERALLMVVRARASAATGGRRGAVRALARAEQDLAATRPGEEEPGRVFFFSEASLAHETACTLRDLGDLGGATREFSRSVRLREAATFARTHSVTLGYLGSVQARQGQIEQACATWTRALDCMTGVRSGRARRTATDIRAALSPVRARGVRGAAAVQTRADDYLNWAAASDGGRR